MIYLASIFNLITKFADVSAGQACSLHRDAFFFFPSWAEYLKGTYNHLGECAPVFNPPGDFFLVGLAMLDMLIRLAGFVAVVSIMIAGLEYILSTGNAEKTTNARRRIIYSLTGLGIALVATAAVGYIGRVFGG